MASHNFVENYPELSTWSPPLADASSSPEKNRTLLKQYLTSFIHYARHRPLFWIPPVSMLSLSILLRLFTVPSDLTINRLSFDHVAFQDLTTRQRFLQTQAASLKTEVQSYKPFFEISAPALEFTSYLQDITPERVQLSAYSIDNTGFLMQASASAIEPLNDLILLVSNQPAVAKGSVNLTSISRIGQVVSPSSSAQPINPSAPANAELNGRFQSLSFTDQISLFQRRNSYGQLDKLNSFYKLYNLLR